MINPKIQNLISKNTCDLKGLGLSFCDAFYCFMLKNLFNKLTVLIKYSILCISCLNIQFASASKLELTYNRIDSLLKNPATDIHGPNCFNSSLFAVGYTDSIRFSSMLEVLGVINSKYCKEKPLSELDELDIVVYVNTNQNEIIHTTVYLEEGKYFNKMDKSLHSTYEVVDTLPVDKRYLSSGVEKKVYSCNFNLFKGSLNPVDIKVKKIENYLSARLISPQVISEEHPAIVRDRRGIFSEGEWLTLLKESEQLFVLSNQAIKHTEIVDSKMEGIRSSLREYTGNLCGDEDLLKFYKIALKIDENLIKFCEQKKLNCSFPRSPLSYKESECRGLIEKGNAQFYRPLQK